MFQLIIGILSGVILLFVVLLLIIELVGTYPVWKHFKRNFFEFNRKLLPTKKRKNLSFPILAVAGVLGLCGVSFLIASALPQKRKVTDETAKSTTTAVVVKKGKKLVDSLSVRGLFFVSDTKWEDEKIYCNTRVFLENPQPPNFSELRFSFLDRDGFLIKELRLTPNDFVAETNGYGGVSALLDQCNTEMSLKEYGRIDKLHVVLDKKQAINNN